MTNPPTQPPRLNRSFSPAENDNEDSDDEDDDQEMANSESTATTPAFSAMDSQASAYKSPQSTHTSPALDPAMPRLSSSSSSSSYAPSSVSTVPSPAYGPQHTPFQGPRFGYSHSAGPSPMLLPDSKHPDHEATAALLMLNQDRRNPCSGRGMSVKDLLSS